jgi:hypothetical protein
LEIQHRFNRDDGFAAAARRAGACYRGVYRDPRRRRKSAPVRERALLAINALWPDGVPSEIILLNCTLCNEINAWLKKRSLPEVKDDTILRAAKRRR